MARTDEAIKEDEYRPLEVWYRGWKVHFSNDGSAKPKFEKLGSDEEPPKDGNSDGDKLICETQEDETWFRHRDWVVVFEDVATEPVPVSVSPPKTTVRRYVYDIDSPS